MASADNLPPRSLGLGGDGDEIAAIKEVERAFGVRLDYSGARNWLTVGHVFAALLQSLPPEQADMSETWSLFAQAISSETGVDPSHVRVDTLLLGQAHFDRRVALIVASVIGVVLALAHFW